MAVPVYEATKSGNFTWTDIATADDKKMAKLRMDGDPNPTNLAELGAVSWTMFTKEAEMTLRLVDESAGGTRAQQDLTKEACNWQTELALAGGLQ